MKQLNPNNFFQLILAILLSGVATPPQSMADSRIYYTELNSNNSTQFNVGKVGSVLTDGTDKRTHLTDLSNPRAIAYDYDNKKSFFL